MHSVLIVFLFGKGCCGVEMFLSFHALEIIKASLDPQTQSEYFTIIFQFFQLTHSRKHLKPTEFPTLRIILYVKLP